MKVTSKVLSIPPYLATTWDQVASISVNGGLLSVMLKEGGRVEIPGLSEMAMREIFEAHTRHAEEPAQPEMMMGMPFQMMPGQPMAMEHDPSQSEAPDLPSEVLSKIASITQVLGVEPVGGVPEPEAGCNCFYCQVVRTMGEGLTPSEAVSEEEVSDEELQFAEPWEIAESGDKLYTVTSRLDGSEQYSVYLGEPVGCTCGQKGCDHIKAVLNS